MAGIGVKLNKIYEKNTLTSDLYGFLYSTLVTIAPMLVVMGGVLLMRLLLGFSALGYAERSCILALCYICLYFRSW